jgi:hypothetical protein
MDFSNLTPEEKEDLDSIIEDKFMNNLQWSMLFFVFNNICQHLNDESSDTLKSKNSLSAQKEFFNGWKKFVSKNLIKKDLESINKTLNSPKNIFYSVLQNKDNTIESTEFYQQKYNTILKNVEKFFIESFENRK